DLTVTGVQTLCSSDLTPTVLQNELGGTPAFARTATGIYTATLTDGFPASKTIVLVQPLPYTGIPNLVYICQVVHTSPNVISFYKIGRASCRERVYITM